MSYCKSMHPIMIWWTSVTFLYHQYKSVKHQEKEIIFLFESISFIVKIIVTSIHFFKHKQQWIHTRAVTTFAHLWVVHQHFLPKSCTVFYASAAWKNASSSYKFYLLICSSSFRRVSRKYSTAFNECRTFEWKFKNPLRTFEQRH